MLVHYIGIGPTSRLLETAKFNTNNTRKEMHKSNQGHPFRNIDIVFCEQRLLMGCLPTHPRRTPAQTSTQPPVAHDVEHLAVKQRQTATHNDNREITADSVK